MICHRLFSHISFSTAGKAKFCCVATPTAHSLGLESLDDIWQSDEFNKAREQFANGEWPEQCAVCEIAESANLFSHRNRYETTDYDQIDKFLNNQKLDLPVSYDLRFGNKCNLKCRMCHPQASDQIQKELNEHTRYLYISDFLSQTLFDANQLTDWWKTEIGKENIQLLTDSANEIRFAGGEPFINAEVEAILDSLIELKHNDIAKIKFSTNGISFNKGLLDKIAKFKHHYIGVSIDGQDEVFEYIRYPAKWNKIVKTLQYLYDNKFRFDIHYTVQIANIFTFEDDMKYFAQYNRNCHINFVRTPDYLAINNLPNELKEQLNTTINNEEVLTFLNQPGDPELLKEALKVNDTYDLIRSQNSRDIMKEIYNVLRP